MTSNLRYAIRTLRKSPVFTMTALATLALGIGANVAIFSVVNAVLLKPLGYPDPDRIVYFFMTTTAGPSYGASATKFNILRQQTSLFRDVAAYEFRGSGLNVSDGSLQQQVHATHVSEAYFRLLGAPMALGRAFTRDEDRPGGPHVAVMSYGLWQRRFAAEPGIVGKTISLSGVPYVIVGVVGRDFNTELDRPPDLWLPFQIDPESTDHAQYFNVIGRLRPGVTLAMANAQLEGASAEFRRRFPNIMGLRDRFSVEPFGYAIVSDVRSSLLVLAGAVGFVLLIACANVANLLLVRATGRKREIAIRAAVGAGRGRIVRQLLTESIVLALAGGAAGLFLGMAGVRALLASNPGDLPRLGPENAVAIDWHVALFTIGASVFSGVVFGLMPALGVSRPDLVVSLKEGGRSGTSVRQNRIRAVLVSAQMAMAVLLLIGSALLIRTFVALRSVDPGFDARGVLTMRMSTAGSRFRDTASLDALIRDGVERVQAIPGVMRATATYVVPLEGAFGVPFNIVGGSNGNSRYDGRGWAGVSPGYFEVFRIPLLRGRVFGDRDDGAAQRVAIINQAMVRRFWPTGDPIGQQLILGRGYGPAFTEPARQIVGVVGDVRNSGLDQDPQPIVYVPMAQVTDGITTLANRETTLAWAVRTRTEPHSLASRVRTALQQASGGLPVMKVRSMADITAESTARASFNMSLLTIFGGMALLLAIIGIYGVMAYSVQQRKQDIGIRLALGAAAGQVRNAVVWQGMRLVMAGIAVGVLAALGLGRVIAGFLFGVRPSDPLVFTLVPLVLTTAALLAVWIPARKAARTDPVDALRCE